MTDTTNINELTGQSEKQRATLSLVELDLRDYFAAKAMQSMLLDTKQFAGCGLEEAPLAAVPDIIAAWSYLMADAMLRAREDRDAA